MTRSEWKETPQGRVELATYTHEGRDFTNLGAMVTPTHAAGYPKGFASHEGREHGTGTLHAWDGTPLGTARIVASWRTPRSLIGSRMYQIECEIDGRTYTGRGCGSGLLWRGKLKSNRPR